MRLRPALSRTQTLRLHQLLAPLYRRGHLRSQVPRLRGPKESRRVVVFHVHQRLVGGRHAEDVLLSAGLGALWRILTLILSLVPRLTLLVGRRLQLLIHAGLEEASKPVGVFGGHGRGMQLVAHVEESAVMNIR